MSEFRQLTKPEELKGKTITRVDFDEDDYNWGDTLIIFTDETYVVFKVYVDVDIDCDYTSYMKILTREPEITYRVKHGIASPAEVAEDQQRAEREALETQERIARRNRAEYERLKAMFEAEANTREKGH
jgi:hypothetical protein